MSALRWPQPSQEVGALRGPPQGAWSDYLEEPGPPRNACSHPVWSADEEPKDGDSSVSSGRLSGSSGGHESGTFPRGPWKERTPQVRGPSRRPRESSPRLEQLRGKIRAQARRQASCASLGTSTPSSASHLYKTPTPAARRKARKPAKPPPASAFPGSGIQSGSESGVEDKATPGQGREPSRVSRRQPSVPRENLKSMKSRSCKSEKAPKPPPPRRTAKDTGHSKKAAAGESSPVQPQVPSPASVCSDPQVSATAPPAASRDQAVNIQAAMAILRDLRQQIQVGLELARDRHPRRGLELRDLAGRRRPGPRSPPDVRGAFWKSPRTTTEGVAASSERAGSLPTAPRWSSSARRDICPQRAWVAQGLDPSLQKPGSPPERLSSFPQRPWSASPRQASSPQRTWAAPGLDPSLQRPGSPPERLGPFLQRPWSASAGQAPGPQRAWTACQDREGPARRPWSPPERPCPPRWRPRSASFLQGPSPLCRDRGSLLSASGTELAWLRPSRGALRSELRPPPPCPKPRGPLGPPCSPESLRQRTVGWRREALEKKASAERAQEPRKQQRRQDTYRKQKEAVLSKAIPVVSQTTPGIVTFVPHSAQSRGLEAPGSPGAPVLEWSKVTSGMVLGDQEAPGSFCLCLNRALSPAKILETGGSQDGWEGAPLLMSASSPGPLRLQDLAAHYPRPGPCIYLDPEESERLGLPGPLRLSCKQAQLQALETTANILQQRIDTLTDKLRESEATDTPGDPGPDPPPWSSGTPACPGTLVPSVARGAPWDWAGMQARPLLSPRCFLDGETLPRSPDWELQQGASPRGHHASQPRGFVEDGRLDLGKRLARNTASFQALSPFAGSSLGAPATPDARCGSLRREEMRSARGAGLVTPWTPRSCERDKATLTSLCGRIGPCRCIQSEPPAPARPPGAAPDKTHASMGAWWSAHLTGPLSNIQQKSLSFLESLKLDQQKQERELALLRQQAELEVWETQKALGELLFQHRLERLMEKHPTRARPGTASEPEWPQVRVDAELMASRDTVTARPRSHPLLPSDAAVPSLSPQEGRKSRTDTSARAEPVQEGRPDQSPSRWPPARLCPWDDPNRQGRQKGPRGPAPGAFGRFALQLLEQSLRDEELRAQHRAALLRLREKALEEKARAELAWLEQRRRGCLSGNGSYTALLALAGKQHQALSNLEQEQREIRRLRKQHLLSHQERKLLLQHQKDALSMRRSTALSQQEPRAQTGLLQSSSPEVKAARQEGSQTSWQPEGPAQGSLCPPTPQHISHRPSGSPESPQVPHPCTEQQDGTAARAALAVDGHPQPPKLAWGEEAPAAGDWPDTGGQLVESHSHVGQEPREQPGVALPGVQWAASPDPGQPPGPAFPTQADEAEGGVGAAQLCSRPVEEPPLGDPQPHPSPWSAEEKTRALPESVQGRSQQSPGTEGPCGPQQASQVVEGGRSRVDPASGPPEEPHAMECWSGEQRDKTSGQEAPGGPFSCQEAAQLPASPAAAAAGLAAPPTQPEGSPRAQLLAPSDLGSEAESAPRTCSGSSAPSPASPSGDSLSCPSLQEFRKVSAVLVQLSESSASLSDWEAGDTPEADLAWSGPVSAPDSSGSHQGRGQVTREGLEGRVGGGPREGWLLPLADTPSPRSGSELSEASSQIWDQGSLCELGARAGPAPEPRAPGPLAPGCSSPAGGSFRLEPRLHSAPSLGPGEGQRQEDSGARGSLARETNTGKARGWSLEVAGVNFPSRTSSSGDSHLSLSLRLGASASEGAGLGKGGEPGPVQASGGCPEVPREAHPHLSAAKNPPLRQASSEPEVPLSPRAPPGDPGGLAAESRAPGWGGCRAPSAPEEAWPPPAEGVLPEVQSPVDGMLTYGSADLPSSTHGDPRLPPPPPNLPAEHEAEPAGPDSEDFPSPPEATVSPAGSLGAPGEDASVITGDLPSLSEEGLPQALPPGPQDSGLLLGGARQGGGLGDQWGESGSAGKDWAVGGQESPLCGGAGDAPEGLSAQLAQPPALSRVACAPGESLLLLLAAGDPGASGSGQGGPRADLPGMGRAQVVDLVSTQLTRRILCDTLAALTEPAPPSGLVTEERAGAAGGPRLTAAAGQSRGRRDF
ncbi:coiled-coil domain-containing protein 187 isoform X6 [Phacochoerus africanus]|uniref:coiled-coil domain-containing protein 187 isoform X6 n=1 Tax=Phacochoerus africanus TaxID=41426 RepID=UPI001FD96BE9|nr:coiled-coil domain-containing protein 187 isoform X6 [Phacochoerus africanus]